MGRIAGAALQDGWGAPLHRGDMRARFRFRPPPRFFAKLAEPAPSMVDKYRKYFGPAKQGGVHRVFKYGGAKSGPHFAENPWITDLAGFSRSFSPCSKIRQEFPPPL